MAYVRRCLITVFQIKHVNKVKILCYYFASCDLEYNIRKGQKSLMIKDKHEWMMLLYNIVMFSGNWTRALKSITSNVEYTVIQVYSQMFIKQSIHTHLIWCVCVAVCVKIRFWVQGAWTHVLELQTFTTFNVHSINGTTGTLPCIPEQIGRFHNCTLFL